MSEDRAQSPIAGLATLRPETRSADFKANAARTLVGLGFSDTEALAYCELLRLPGATAYRVATLIGKSQANATLALKGLVRKGAVVTNEGSPKTYHPLPPDELIATLSQELNARVEAADSALAKLDLRQEQDRILKLSTLKEVYARANAMLESASETALFILSPAPFDHLRDVLSETSGRIAVAGMLMQEESLPGARTVLSGQAERLRATPVDLLVLITDAREMLISHVEPGCRDPREALWTNNPLLTGLFHNGIASDVILHGDALIEKIVSPNRYLFDCTPKAIGRLFRAL